MKKMFILVTLLTVFVMTACARKENVCTKCEYNYMYNQWLADVYYCDDYNENCCIAFVVYTSDRGQFTLTYDRGTTVYVHNHNTGEVTIHKINKYSEPEFPELETYTEIEYVPIN